MNFQTYRALLRADFHRVYPKLTLRVLLRELLFGIGVKFCFCFRTASFVRSRPLLKYTLGPLCYLIFNHYRFKFGIDIAPGTEIGGGLYIGHFGCIIVSPKAVIGRNCNLSQGVTLGKKSGGKHPGYPRIGNRVYIGPGVKVIGGVTVGDGCIVGANAVVSSDCPPDSVMAGIPARCIGSAINLSYLNHTEN